MIRTRSLGLRYAGGPALGFPDLDVPQGGVLLLQGDSGCGKSTLLALLAGLLQPSQGSATVGGAELQALSASQRDAWRARQLGFMPQRLHLSASLTVADNLALPYFCAGLPVDQDRIAAVMHRLGLNGLATRHPRALSVGQAQRVALARAVVRSPQVLMADEPTASLDDLQARAVIELLHQTATSTGATLVLATHDARVVAWFAEGDGTRVQHVRLEPHEETPGRPQFPQAPQGADDAGRRPGGALP